MGPRQVGYLVRSLCTLLRVLFLTLRRELDLCRFDLWPTCAARQFASVCTLLEVRYEPLYRPGRFGVDSRRVLGGDHDLETCIRSLLEVADRGGGLLPCHL